MNPPVAGKVEGVVGDAPNLNPTVAEAVGGLNPTEAEPEEEDPRGTPPKAPLLAEGGGRNGDVLESEVDDVKPKIRPPDDPTDTDTGVLLLLKADVADAVAPAPGLVA